MLTSQTITRLDPKYPPLWRDGETVQFGMNGTLRVPAAEPWVEGLLAQMCAGFRRASFDVIAHGVGAPRDAARSLLATLGPLLHDDPPPLPAGWIESINFADARDEVRMGEALAELGVPRGDRDNPEHIGVILVQGAAAALQLASYLRDDTPHLPISFEAGTLTVGPLVRPGESPCLSCRDSHERERDSAWPLLHAQLIGRKCPPLTSMRLAQAAGFVARILASQKHEHGLMVSAGATDRPVWQRVAFHEECLCHGQWSQSQPGIEMAPVPLALRRETTTTPAFARRA